MFGFLSDPTRQKGTRCAGEGGVDFNAHLLPEKGKNTTDVCSSLTMEPPLDEVLNTRDGTVQACPEYDYTQIQAV